MARQRKLSPERKEFIDSLIASSAVKGSSGR